MRKKFNENKWNVITFYKGENVDILQKRKETITGVFRIVCIRKLKIGLRKVPMNVVGKVILHVGWFCASNLFIVVKPSKITEQITSCR